MAMFNSLYVHQRVKAIEFHFWLIFPMVGKENH